MFVGRQRSDCREDHVDGDEFCENELNCVSRKRIFQRPLSRIERRWN